MKPLKKLVSNCFDFFLNFFFVCYFNFFFNVLVLTEFVNNNSVVHFISFDFILSHLNEFAFHFEKPMFAASGD